jgi:N-acetylglutamate synthase-like GNAT family acetyltransferase
MKHQWKIRRAVVGDAVELKNCMTLAYAPYQHRMEDKRLPPMDLDYSSEIRNFPTWVLEQDGSIVGGLTMNFASAHASIANIAIHPEFQGQGLGSGLMNFAETKARELNFTELRLVTHVLLTENVSLLYPFSASWTV